MSSKPPVLDASDVALLQRANDYYTKIVDYYTLNKHGTELVLYQGKACETIMRSWPISQHLASGHDKVLEVLKQLRRDNEEFIIYHNDHTRLKKHFSDGRYGTYGRNNGPECTHECKIVDAIAYVLQMKKEEKTPHKLFNSIGRNLGRAYSKLSVNSNGFIIGAFPSAMISVIGLLQTIIGIATSILFSAPAIFSKNARIIVSRSFRHFHLGPCNVLKGIWKILQSTILHFSPFTHLNSFSIIPAN